MEEKTARTKLDILYHDVLGEINETITHIESLKNILPNQIVDIENRLTDIIGTLDRAGAGYQQAIDQYTTAAGNKIWQQLERDYMECRKKAHTDLNDAIVAALNNIERTAKKSIEREVGRLVGEYRQSPIEKMGQFFASAVLGGLIVLLGCWYYQSSFTALGHATADAWTKLDQKSRSTIEAERK